MDCNKQTKDLDRGTCRYETCLYEKKRKKIKIFDLKKYYTKFSRFWTDFKKYLVIKEK